ncbi:hypothetical protein TD95_002582 [Thielaviopsis punctulata]|uniref:Poly [ADP-ribose] polymerase n=1 Tax=Thielaviopsis punctulata TaxID=72032 RepID=A0A0F4ZDZ7_9PEZI|nr:hypothetical protein TD95_002582 [Thielaviopsis punctulata]
MTSPTATNSSAPLAACAVAVSGVFRRFTHGQIEEIVKELGGIVTKSVTRTTTHLITTEHDYNAMASKVKGAVSRGLPIVTLDWLLDTQNKKAHQAETDYFVSSLVSKPPTSSTPPPRKRSLASLTSSPTLPKKAKLADASPSAKDVSTADCKTDVAASPQIKSGPLADGQISKSSSLVVPLDHPPSFPNAKVYIDDNGLIYDASLNQTNAQNNNNKFYRLQLIQMHNGDYATWTRWGRVGEWGQKNTLSGNLDMCIREFGKKFRSKSGYPFPETGTPKPGKYVFVERSYEPDDDEDEQQKEAKSEPGAVKEEHKPIESKLEKPVQKLAELIFNKAYISSAMEAMNYDANKLPLGKLSKKTISRGFEMLKKLGATINDQPEYLQELRMDKLSAIVYLSNSYYSVIPHAFGRNRPPIIQSGHMLKREIELLESLSNMKAAEDIMKLTTETPKTNLLDHHFDALGLQSISVLDHSSSEFVALLNYLEITRGATHNLSYKIQDIYRIERPGEKDRIDTLPFSSGPKSNRRLLWHGSRSTNYAGILSQGLRIAPPEAPVSGYMFGKGIYLADMSSKSANYCYSNYSGGYALLLLCEAELGQMQKLVRADYNADKLAANTGSGSTLGMGRTGPTQWKDAGCVHPSLAGISMPNTDLAPGSTNVPDATLLYNEYIAYNVSQVRLRYLFRVSMKS